MQVGATVKLCDPPGERDAFGGETEIDLNTGPELAVTAITVEVPTVVSPSVALTKMPTVPAVVPALKLFVEPLLPSAPRLVLVRDHE